MMLDSASSQLVSQLNPDRPASKQPSTEPVAALEGEPRREGRRRWDGFDLTWDGLELRPTANDCKLRGKGDRGPAIRWRLLPDALHHLFSRPRPGL